MKFDAANIEDKAQTTDEIRKEVIAFANTDGGMVDIGSEMCNTAVLFSSGLFFDEPSLLTLCIYPQSYR